MNRTRGEARKVGLGVVEPSSLKPEIEKWQGRPKAPPATQMRHGNPREGGGGGKNKEVKEQNLKCVDVYI